MRARMRWRSRIPNDHLPVILDVLGWMPHIAQDNHEVMAHRDRILATLPDNIRSTAREQYVLTVYRARTNTWGIVTREQPDLLTFRIESADSADAHKAAEDLCESLAIEYGKHWRVRDHSFQIVGTLDILERNGEHLIHDGSFVRGRIRRALRDRSLETFTAVLLFVLAGLSFLASRPTAFIDPTTLDGQRTTWVLEFWGRLGTAFAASAVTAVIYVAFRLLSISRHRYVVWNPPKNK